ncbi:MAG: hypothetical protein ACR2N8_03545 [Parvibaculales bacterium]
MKTLKGIGIYLLIVFFGGLFDPELASWGGFFIFGIFGVLLIKNAQVTSQKVIGGLLIAWQILAIVASIQYALRYHI